MLSKVLVVLVGFFIGTTAVASFYAWHLHNENVGYAARLNRVAEATKKIEADNKQVTEAVTTLAEKVNEDVKKSIPAVRAYAAGLRMRDYPNCGGGTTTEPSTGTSQPDEGTPDDVPTVGELQADCAETTVMLLQWQWYYTDLLKTWNTVDYPTEPTYDSGSVGSGESVSDVSD